ncbi:MAG: aminotransferase class III-fold pyridoxal phosphate-dependent enzyme, partial [Rhodospirillaceae bacterium]
MNYGHNHPVLAKALTSYIAEGGIVHSLDLHTAAKERFLSALNKIILEPRGLDYVAQFTGPTGTNAVEAALKLARRLKGRSTVVSFTNGFHGVSLGALAATGNYYHRSAAQMPLTGVVPMPYDGYMDGDMDTLAYFERMLS